MRSEACTLSLENAPPGRAATRFQAGPRQPGLPHAMPPRALNVGTPGENLLGLIPGPRVHHVEQGCSGMAGTFGLLHRNYRSSLRAGWGSSPASAIRPSRPAHRVQRLQDPDGARHHQAHYPPHQTAGLGLRSDARGGRAADHAGRRAVTANLTADRTLRHDVMIATLVSRRFAFRMYAVRRLLHRGAGLRLGQQGGDRRHGRGVRLGRRRNSSGATSAGSESARASSSCPTATASSSTARAGPASSTRRPRQCRTWPFWASNLATPAAWERMCERCPGGNRGPLTPLRTIQGKLGIINV